MILRRRRVTAGPAGDLETLAAAARAGDGAALAALRADLPPEALPPLAAVLGLVDPDAVEVLAAARAVAARHAGHGATLRADPDTDPDADLSAHLAAGADADPAGAEPAAAGREVLGRVVVLLLDAGGRSAAAVAELLDLPEQAVGEARALALALTGPQSAPPACRGWALVAAPDRLTPEEREAATAHLEGCRRCATARAAVGQGLRRAPVVPAPRAPRA